MIVFDMAGTTVDEKNVVYKTLCYAINAEGFAVSFESVLAIGAGKEKKQAIADILDGEVANADVIDGIYARFQEMLEAAYKTLAVQPQEGAIPIFHYLRRKDIKVVLNTGYDQRTANQLINKLGWQLGVDFDWLITASQVADSRPAPDMIQLAQAHFRIHDAKQIAKIGDSTIDIEEGRNAGCGLVLGITTGAHTRSQLDAAEPDGILNSLWELREWV